MESVAEDISGDRVFGGVVFVGRYRGYLGIWKMGRGGMLRIFRYRLI